MNKEIIVFGSLIYFFAAMLQGITGFGFSLLAVPLLTMLISPKTVIPIMLLLSMILNVAVMLSSIRSLSFKKIYIILIAAVITMPIGTYFLVSVPDYLIEFLIGILILSFGTYLFLGYQFKIKREKIVQVLVGFASGILGGAVAMSGPPLVMFFANRREKKNPFRVNLVLYYFCLNLFIIPVYAFNNLLTTRVFNLSLVFLPALVLGAIAGNLLARKLPEHIFRRATLILLLIMGLLAILNGFKVI
ncbi:MAG: sulfite exporter TauE/SafE family protein [Candidatus Cloacimonetes bacterium]|nr:sulfite exporter TauE/SafE family protein [Candidatus Cloacimonadota bacterium]